MIKIITNKSTTVPAKEIANALNNMNVEATVVTNMKNVQNYDKVICYGYSAPAPFDNRINSSKFISLCGNKLMFSHVLTVSGFNTPVYYSYDSHIKPTEYPVVVRTTLHGMGGIGITFASNEQEFNQQFHYDCYWTKYFNCEFELRVHVLGGEVVRIFKKMKDNEDKYPIRNSEHGYHYSLRTIDNYDKVLTLVERLSEVIGIDNFYALDVGYDAESGSYVIYEANSAPGLNPNTAKIYAEYFKNRLV